MDAQPETLTEIMRRRIAADPTVLADAQRDLNATVLRETGRALPVKMFLLPGADGVWEIRPEVELTAELFNEELPDELLELVSAGSTSYCCNPPPYPCACSDTAQG